MEGPAQAQGVWESGQRALKEEVISQNMMAMTLTFSFASHLGENVGFPEYSAPLVALCILGTSLWIPCNSAPIRAKAASPVLKEGGASSPQGLSKL
jgi:hypothetical protein